MIPSRNGRDLLQAMLPEVARQVQQTGGEIIVVDNGSDDGTADFLRREFPGVVLEVSADAAVICARRECGHPKVAL